MAGIGSYAFESKELAKGLTATITIHGMRQYRFRLWVSMILIRLACCISWMECHIEHSEEDGNAVVSPKRLLEQELQEQVDRDYEERESATMLPKPPTPPPSYST